MKSFLFLKPYPLILERPWLSQVHACVAMPLLKRASAYRRSHAPLTAIVFDILALTTTFIDCTSFGREMYVYLPPWNSWYTEQCLRKYLAAIHCPLHLSLVYLLALPTVVGMLYKMSRLVTNIGETMTWPLLVNRIATILHVQHFCDLVGFKELSRFSLNSIGSFHCRNISILCLN